MYRPCYAPTFRPRSALDCALYAIRGAFLLALLAILLIITFGSQGILCRMRQVAYRMRHCREGNSDPAIDIGFTLDRWIRETPRIRSAIIWRPDGDRAIAYPDWSRADKALLAELYEQLAETGDAGLDVEPPIAGFRYFDEGRGERLNTVAATAYDLDVGRRTFFAHVAQSLLAEIQGEVPWRLDELSDAQLAYLFDSQHMYGWNRDLGRHVLWTGLGKATPGDPGRVHAWLRANGIIRLNRLDTVVAMLEWCRNMRHDSALVIDDVPDTRPGSRDGNELHWQYEGFQPVERTLAGTRRGDSPRDAHWTGGCQGTTGFLRCVLRTVNIPVKREDGCGHAIPHFLAERVFLSHGDDPYNGRMRWTPPIPMREILVPADRLPGFFDDCDRVGWGVVNALQERLPEPLLEMRCRDLAAGAADDGGEVWEVFERYFSLAELREARLWERLDEEIERRGGCSNIVGPG